MAWETKDLLNLSVVQGWDSSLSLNALLCLLMVLSHHRTSRPHQCVELCCVPLVDAASSAHHSVEENAGYPGPYPLQEMEPSLALPVEGIGVSRPVQFAIQL